MTIALSANRIIDVCSDLKKSKEQKSEIIRNILKGIYKDGEISGFDSAKRLIDKIENPFLFSN